MTRALQQELGVAKVKQERIPRITKLSGAAKEAAPRFYTPTPVQVATSLYDSGDDAHSDVETTHTGKGSSR